MPDLKTCLLISDDPDDHQILSEAIKEISDNVILLIVLENSHALKILKEKKLAPDYLIVDFLSDGINGEQFLKEISEHTAFINLPIVVYSTDPVGKHFETVKKVAFLNKHSSYSELRSTLKTFIQKHP